MFRLTDQMRSVGNAQYEARLCAELGQKVRAFRPEPVSNLGDRELSWVIARSRRAALDFGVRDPDTLEDWIMVEALLAPGFFAMPEVAVHFRDAFGDPDTKAGDLLRQIRIDLRDNGRADEIWW